MSERPHGYNRYKTDGCRCFTCRVDNSRYMRDYRAGRGTMQVDYVPARPVMEHILHLSACGVGYRRLAELTGVHDRTIRRWRYGETDVVSKALAVRVLAVQPDAAAPRWLEATGTRRRIQALAAIGWPVTEMAPRVGWRISNFSQLLRRSGVQRATARKVETLYDELSMLVPEESLSVVRARARARRDMWFPPLAWDDEKLDDPDALPCMLPPVGPCDPATELLVQHAVAGHEVRLTPEARLEIVRRLPGVSRYELARIARCHPETIGKLKKVAA